MSDFSERYQVIYNAYEWQCANIGAKASEAGLARFLGVIQTAPLRWKAGQLPNAKDVKAIHDKLGFNYDWLIAGEGDMHDPALHGAPAEASLKSAAGQN